AKGAVKAVKGTVDQHGCKFVPHVTAMTPGELDLKNSDDILHNIHTYSTANPSINKAQPKFKKVMTEKFEKPEIIKLTCRSDLKTSDDILHNIHTYSTANPSINKAQPKFKKVMTEKFEKPEIIKLTG